MGQRFARQAQTRSQSLHACGNKARFQSSKRRTGSVKLRSERLLRLPFASSFHFQISELRQTASKKPPSVRDRGAGKPSAGTTSIRPLPHGNGLGKHGTFSALYAHSAITGEPGESLLQISAHSSRDVFTQAAAYRFAPTNGSLKTTRARLLLPGHGHCRYYSILSGACQVPGKKFFLRGTEGDRSPRIARKRPYIRCVRNTAPTDRLHLHFCRSLRQACIFLFRKNDKSS